MPKIRITKKFNFEAAHALSNYDGPCRNIHGHSYKLNVTVAGSPSADISSPKYGMLLDFSVLKRIVNENIINKYDHSLMLREDVNLSKELSEAYNNVIILPYQPTSENMIVSFAEVLKNKLPDGVELFSIRLYETESSYVEWFNSDNI